MHYRKDNSKSFLSKLNGDKPGYFVQFVQTIQSTELTGVLDNIAKSRWFDWGALVLFSLKFIVCVLRYIFATNKNLYQKAQLGFSVATAAMTIGAAVGTLVLLGTFVVAGAALIVSALAIDTLRNIGGFFFNLGRLAFLRFKMRKALKEPAENASEKEQLEYKLALEKYRHLRSKYLDKLKDYAVGSVIGLVMTIATGIVVLAPHVGLGFIAAIPVVIGGVKLTVGAIAGIAAVAVPLMPTIYKVGKWLKGVIKDRMHKPTKTLAITGDIETNVRTPLLVKEKSPELAFALTAKPIKVTKQTVTTALDHKIDYATDYKFREIIVRNCDSKATAKEAFKIWLNDKIKKLSDEISGNLGFFASLQREKRKDKLMALYLIQHHLFGKDSLALSVDIIKDITTTLQPTKQGNAGDKAKQSNPKRESSKTEAQDVIDKLHDAIVDSEYNLIPYIERTFPGVYSSLFNDQSDTHNFIAALKEYQLLPDPVEKSDNGLNTFIFKN